MGRVGVGLELAAGGAVRGVLGVILIVVLVHPALEEAEFVLCGVQAAPVGRVECLQGHHVLVRDDTVQAAAIDDVDGDRARDRTETGDVGRPSANAGDQEGEEHLERDDVRVLWGGWGRVVTGETWLCRARATSRSVPPAHMPWLTRKSVRVSAPWHAGRGLAAWAKLTRVCSRCTRWKSARFIARRGACRL